MTMEAKIRNTLMERGLSNSEASREAFNYVNAWIDGEIEPETIASLIGEPVSAL